MKQTNCYKRLSVYLDRSGILLLGRVMYPEYEKYWLAVLANPSGILPLSGRSATKNEIAYARWADSSH